MISIVHQLPLQLAEQVITKGLKIVTAESCTGGWVAETITSIAGSSDWFDRGFVTYSNAAKQEMLGIRASTLEHYGAVSEQTVREMAEGALSHSHANLSVAITGIAGPSGGTPEKPVGTVWFGWSLRKSNDFLTITKLEHYAGDRQEIRQQAVIAALKGLLSLATEQSDR